MQFEELVAYEGLTYQSSLPLVEDDSDFGALYKACAIHGSRQLEYQYISAQGTQGADERR
jgi:hypothetical protein